MLNLVCRRISIVFAFSYGPAKTIRIRHVWMRIYLKTEKKKSPLSKISGYAWTGISDDYIHYPFEKIWL